MKLTLWQRLDLAARQTTPALLTILAVMVTMLPLRLPDFGPVAPWLALISVYYWSVHRPDLMPALAVFAIGLFSELAGGTPLGVSTLVLLLMHVTAASQRRFFISRSFMVVWCGFATMALGASVLVWFMNMALAGVVVSPRPLAFQFMTTVAAYPLFAWCFAQVQRLIQR